MTDDELSELEAYIQNYWKASDIGAISIEINEARWLIDEIRALRAENRRLIENTHAELFGLVDEMAARLQALQAVENKPSAVQRLLTRYKAFKESK